MCIICDKGISSKKYINIPVKDKESGLVTSYMRVILNGKFHKQLMLHARGCSSLYIIKNK